MGRILPELPQVSVVLDTSGVAPGLYDLLAEIDPATPERPFGQVGEQLESNNSQSLLQSFFKPLEILPQPDLVPTSLVLNPQGPLVLNPQGPLTPGLQVEAFVQVENHGSGPALRPFIVRFTVRLLTPLSPGTSGPREEQPFDDQTLAGLAAGERAAAKGILNTANLPAGSYAICVQLDPPDANHPRGRIPEQDEANNRLCIPPEQQTVGPLSDVRPLSISLTPPSPVHRGQAVKVAVALTNFGKQSSGPFRVDFLIKRDDIAGDVLAPFGQVTFDDLAPGATAVAMATLQTSFRPMGDYEIVVTVNAGSKGNTQISVPLTIDN